MHTQAHDLVRRVALILAALTLAATVAAPVAQAAPGTSPSKPAR